jgi:choline dehydrogenase-like flavoprotein
LQQQLLPAGKILGGTSSINYLIYNRGHRSDYEAWNEDSPGWTFEDVLPYFVKAEKSHVAAYKDSRKRF